MTYMWWGRLQPVLALPKMAVWPATSHRIGFDGRIDDGGIPDEMEPMGDAAVVADLRGARRLNAAMARVQTDLGRLLLEAEALNARFAALMPPAAPAVLEATLESPAIIAE